jgi:hypothetical protein
MKLVDDDINKLLFLVERGEVNVHPCEFADNRGISLYNHLAKSSGSQSEVAFADVLVAGRSNLAVALKLWFNWDDVNQDDLQIFIARNFQKDAEYFDDPNEAKSMTYESVVYKFVTDKFMKTNLSNNFIPFIAVSQCDLKDIKAALDSNILKASKSLAKFYDNFKTLKGLKLNILATGTLKDSSKLQSMQDFLTTTLPGLGNTLEILRSIIVQILYALFLMQEAKLNHNDLHLKNILIETLDADQEINIEAYSFTTRYIPRIYDWDLSYLEMLGPNPKLESGFEEINLGNKFRKGSDYYQFICGLTNNLKNPEKMLANVVPNPYLSDWGAFDLSGGSRYALEQSELLSLRDYGRSINAPEQGSDMYLQIPMSEFKKRLTVSDWRNLLDAKGKEKLKGFETLYIKVRYNFREKYIMFLKGHHCYPIHNDPNETILYPLDELLNPSSNLFKKLVEPLAFYASWMV